MYSMSFYDNSIRYENSFDLAGPLCSAEHTLRNVTLNHSQLCGSVSQFIGREGKVGHEPRNY